MSIDFRICFEILTLIIFFSFELQINFYLLQMICLKVWSLFSQ